MRPVLYGLTFLAGAVVGGLVVRELALRRVEDLAGGAVDSVLGKGSTYGGIAKSFVNMFVRSGS